MRFNLIFVCCLLASCSMGIKNYVAPTKGPVATIKFVNNGNGSGSVEFFREYETCSGREMSETIPAGSVQEITVQASAPMSFSLGYAVNNVRFEYCRVYGTFTPLANTSYRAEISPLPKGCVLKFYKLGKDQSLSPDFSLTQREAITNPQNEDSSFCK